MGYDAAQSTPEWLYYFLMRMADAHIHEGNLEEAKNCLNIGLDHSTARRDDIYEILFHLSTLKVSLLMWDLPASAMIKQFLENAVSSTPRTTICELKYQDTLNNHTSTFKQCAQTGDVKALPASLGELKNSHLEYHAKNSPTTPATPTAAPTLGLTNSSNYNNNTSANPNMNGTSPSNPPNNNSNYSFTNHASDSNLQANATTTHEFPNTSNNHTNFTNTPISTFTNKLSAPFSYLDNEGVMSVLLNLLFAISSRPNNPQQSILSIDAGVRTAEALLQSGKLTTRQFCSVLRLKFHLFENLFYIRLTQGDLDDALLQIKRCQEIYLHHQQPGEVIGGVGGFRCTIHVMSCLLAHACGMFDVAIKHATLALQESMQLISMLYLLLLYLQTGAIDMVERMISQYCQRLQTHPQRALKVLSTFVEGIVLRIRGANEDARKKLSESLAVGQEINNSQATAQILNEIAHIFLNQASNRINHISASSLLAGHNFNSNQSIGEANELLKRSKDASHAALTLSHHMGDIGTQLVSLRALKNLYQIMNDQSAPAQQHLAYLQHIETTHASHVRSVQHNVDFVLLLQLLQ